MSYSFSVRGATILAALAAVAVKFDEVVAQQPVHARDKDAVLANAKNAAEQLTENADKDVSIAVNGYLSWGNGDDGEQRFSSVSIAASAGLVPREAT